MVRTTIDDQQPAEPAAAVARSILDRTLELGQVTWERLIWVLLVALALLLRLIWLDSWPLHPTEAVTATGIWALITQGRVSVPLVDEAGPVVPLLGSFWVFLFGASDISVRMGPALAGAALIGACWWFRPWLGRGGALLAAGLLAFSPLALYESRRLTAEPYAVLWLTILVIALLQLRAGGGRPALLVAAAALALATLTHYLALPIGLLVIGLSVLVARLAGTPTEGSDGLPLTSPGLSRTDWWLALTALVGLTLTVVILAASGGDALLSSLLSPLTGWVASGGAADRTILLLPLLLLLYEPLLLVGALAGSLPAGGTSETVRQRFASLLIVGWAIIALLLASVAGSRDPAQALYPLVPLALLAGRSIGDLIGAINWRTYWRQQGPVLSGVSALALICIVLFVAALTPASPTGAPDQVLRGFLSLLLGLLFCGLTVYLMRPFSFAGGGRIVSLTLLFVLGLYTLRSATQLSFVQPSDATEAVVLDQTAPGVLSVVDRIDRLSRDLTGMRRNDSDVTGGHGLEVAIDRSLAYPLDWYLRDYPARTVFDPSAGVPGNAQMVIVSAAGETTLRASLERTHVGQRYPFRWSFPNGGVSGGLRGLVRFLLFREPSAPAQVQEYAVYLRRDVADRVFFKGGTAADAQANQPAVNLFDRVGRGRAPGQLDSPRGIAADTQGNLYVVDTVNARVQKFDSQGNHIWSTGSAGSGNGQFGRVQNGPGPTGIAVDRQGNVYVADTWNHRIVKLDANGRMLTTWGGFFNTQGNAELGQQHPREFYGPRSIAIGPDNTVYVTDTGNKRVLAFDSEGKPLRQWGGLGSGPSNLNEPVGIAIDSGGTLYVADTYNGRIATFDSQGQPIAQWSVAGWAVNVYQEPYIAVAGDRIYVTNTPGRSVIEFDKRGTILSEERRPGGRELTSPTGITVTPDGGVLVVDTGAHAVVKVK